jgi:hypothetical protein
VKGREGRAAEGRRERKKINTYKTENNLKK